MDPRLQVLLDQVDKIQSIQETNNFNPPIRIGDYEVSRRGKNIYTNHTNGFINSYRHRFNDVDGSAVENMKDYLKHQLTNNHNSTIHQFYSSNETQNHSHPMTTRSMARLKYEVYTPSIDSPINKDKSATDMIKREFREGIDHLSNRWHFSFGTPILPTRETEEESFKRIADQARKEATEYKVKKEMKKLEKSMSLMDIGGDTIVDSQVKEKPKSRTKRNTT